jgi:hypothetical protein
MLVFLIHFHRTIGTLFFHQFVSGRMNPVPAYAIRFEGYLQSFPTDGHNGEIVIPFLASVKVPQVF